MVLLAEEFCDVQEAARQVGIHPLSLHRLMRRGKGPKPAMRAAGRKYLFRLTDLEEWMARYSPRPGPKS